ncbi:DUF2461 domain-containing protein [Planctobacterium marinum]|uniref:TIGR02453 family protein n=1 Tax=Planctobacterium marinum TaxID=1631968 RepID=A0AA48HP71_9ALTE|nr:TIGR02453 family protein [Planctobacterium marinum]
MSFQHFEPSIFQFLKKLKENNNKDWFNDHKQEYEDAVRTPALAFITEMESWIKLLSPHYEAIPKKIGGSLMRVYRDVRFSKDKSPYKTNVGIQFRHEIGKDVHAPGFYLHIEPQQVFLAAGAWAPASDALKNIRDLMVAKPGPYEDAINHQPMLQHFELQGNKLTRPPKGYDKDLPLIEEIKRKDFIAVAELPESFILEPDLPERVARLLGTTQPFMRFLCEALLLRF